METCLLPRLECLFDLLGWIPVWDQCSWAAGKPLSLDPSNGVIGWFDLASLLRLTVGGIGGNS